MRWSGAARPAAVSAVAVAVALAVGAASCGGDELVCIDVDLTCQPLYPPTFDQIFTRTLAPRCGVEGGACHSREGRKAGLVLDDRDQAYRLLVDGRRVMPGEPSCSILIERIYAAPSSLRMPPGRTLADAERCALLQWVQAGAPPADADADAHAHAMTSP
jgi:hypothetical protein